MSNSTFGSLVGHIVQDKNKCYGKVTEIREVVIDNNNVFIALLDTGKAIKLSILAKMFAQSSLYLRRRGDEFIVYAYSKDAHVSKDKFGPQRKRIVSPCVTGNINNTAEFGDERINITSHVSSGNPVYYNKQTMGESK
jgi:hypothetical protein